MSQGGTEKPGSGAKPPTQPGQPTKPGSGPLPVADSAPPQRAAGPGASGVRPSAAATPPPSGPRPTTAATPAAPAARPAPPGKPATPAAGKSGAQQQLQVGHYRVMERIGAGGMGTVYRAIHVDLDREVALKVLPPEMNNNPTMVARFKREAKAAAQLQHENIVQIYDVSEDKGRHFLALEFIRGKDLGEVITQKKMLPVKQSIDYLKQSAWALDHAFQKGIVHRDIKPSNFLITQDGKVKLCDMGLALRTDAGEEAKVTRDGTTVGTVDYMSPEQARDSRLADTRSDIYSLGCTFYQMLTGVVPFPEGSIPEKLFKHSTEAPADPLQFNAEIPSSVLYVLNRMMEKKPEDRYQTPQELIADLENLERDLEKPDDSALKTLAIGAEADEAEAENLVLTRPSTQAVKKRQQEEEAQQKALQAAQKKKWILLGGGGAAAAALLLVVLVIWLATRGGDKPHQLATGPTPVTGSAPTKPTPGPSVGPTPPGPKQPTVGDGTNRDAAGKTGGQQTPDTKAAPPSKQPAAEPTPEPTPEKPEAPDKPIVKAEPGVEPTTPTTPTISDADRERVAREKFPDYPRIKIEGKPVIVARAAQQAGGGVFPSLEAASQAARSGGVNIQLEDNGPLFERGFTVLKSTLDIRPKVNDRQEPQFRPLVAFDIPQERGTPRNYLVQARNSTLSIEGIDFVVNADALADALGTRSFALFDIQGGDLSLKNCTFTIIGKHLAAVSLVQFSSSQEPDPARANRPARLELAGCFARGEPLTAITLTSGWAEVRVMDCVLATGQYFPLFDIQKPTVQAARPQRTIEFVRSTFVSRGDMLQTDGSGNVQTDFKVYDTIMSCSGSGAARKLFRTKSWPEQDGALAMARMEEASSLYTGWDSLLASTFGGKVAAKTIDEWVKAWRLDSSDAQVRGDAWPSQELGDMAKVSPSSFAPAEVAAGIKPRLGVCIGCAIAKLPPEPSYLLERTFGQMPSPELLPLDKILPSYTLVSQKNPMLARWESDQNRRRGAQPGTLKPGDELDPVLQLTFDASSGDLGQFLASQQLLETTTVVVRGSGTKDMTPIRLSGKKSLVLLFQQTGPQPLRLQAAPAAGPADALIDVRDGDLLIDGGQFVYPANATAATPPRFIKVERGNLTLGSCRFYGPLQGGGFVEAIAFTGGPQRSKWPANPNAAGTGAALPPEGVHMDFHPAPHERVNVCQLIDCYIGADPRCIGFESAQAILRMSNSIAVTPGITAMIKLDPRVPKEFEVGVLLDHNTLAASKSFFEVGPWVSEVLPARPLLFDTRDNLFCDPFDVGTGAAARSRTSAVLRYDFGRRILQQGILQWQSSHDGYSHELHSFVLRDDASNPQRGRFDQDWLAIWGRTHIVEPLLDEKRSEKIRLAGTNLKLRDFKPERDLEKLAVQPNCEAAKKASDGGPIGAVTRKPGP